MSRFSSQLLNSVREEGFPLAGLVDIARAAPYFEAHVGRYDAWLAAGHVGAMEYLRRGRDRRADPKLVLPGAKSVLSVALPYPAPPAGNVDPAQGPRYGRYLRHKDYHGDIGEKLERAVKRVAESQEAPKDLSWKVCVDTSAVLERAWAALAGLGWIGKNTLLIHPQHGSYLFLGEILLNFESGEGPRLLPNYCGNCTQCLQACPSQALVSPGCLDANRCIAYWNLEKRGALEISENDRKSMGSWVAGCDLCQEKCPFNSKASRKTGISGSEQDDPLLLDRWESLLSETESDYKTRVRNSSLNRVKPAQFRRNMAIAVANAWTSITDRERRFELQALIDEKAAQETDPAARSEWERCLSITRSLSGEAI